MLTDNLCSKRQEKFSDKVSRFQEEDVPCLPGDGRVSRVEHWPRLVSSPAQTSPAPRYLARPQRRISAPTMRWKRVLYIYTEKTDKGYNGYISYLRNVDTRFIFVFATVCTYITTFLLASLFYNLCAKDL